MVLAYSRGSVEESAAGVSELDLGITGVTAMGHLVGALNLPVWVLLPRWGDWRWMKGSSDTPWYPTMRLFRQLTLPDWSHPIAEVKKCYEDCKNALA